MPRSILALNNFNDPKVGISVCAFNYGDKCKNVKVLNNIVAGTDFAGFATYGHNCGNYDNTFKNNIAHSINGIGAIIFPDFTRPEQSTCYEASYFIGYKNFESGI